MAVSPSAVIPITLATAHVATKWTACSLHSASDGCQPASCDPDHTCNSSHGHQIAKLGDWWDGMTATRAPDCQREEAAAVSLSKQGPFACRAAGLGSACQQRQSELPRPSLNDRPSCRVEQLLPKLLASEASSTAHEQRHHCQRWGCCPK